MADDWWRSRRRFLAGVAASSVLAGCNSSETGSTSTEPEATDGPPTATTDDESVTDAETTESGPAVDPSVDVTLETATVDGQPRVDVTGQATHPAGIDAVTVTVGSSEPVELSRDGATEAAFEVGASVDGGQRYGVDVAVTPRDGDAHSQRALSDYVTRPRRREGEGSTVVANYYPWYSPDRHQAFVDEPVLEDYDSRDDAVIERHVEWATAYGVDAFCASWWGQGSWEDETLREHYLPNDATDDLEFCILYESTEMLGEDFPRSFDDAQTRAQFVDDVAYLAEHYFGEDNYLRIDGKPVVYVYRAMDFQGDVAAAFAAAEDAAGEEVCFVLEIVDWRFPNAHDDKLMRAADGVTAYEMFRSIPDIDDNFAERMAAYYPEWLLAAADHDCAFMPVAMPGFSNRMINDDYDRPAVSRSPERMRRVCELTQRYLDPTLDLSFVTSWNEWHEHTQVEPSEEHGTSDLEIVSDTLAADDTDHWLTDTARFTLSFDETIRESEITGEEYPPGDDRYLAFAAQSVTFTDGDHGEVATFDVGADSEPYFVGGVYAAASHEDRTWRWLGGEAGAVSFVVDADVLTDAELVELRGFPATEGISGALRLGGLELGGVDFGERRSQSYFFDLY